MEYKKGKPKVTDEDKFQLDSTGDVSGRNVFPRQYPKVHCFMEKLEEEKILYFQRNYVMR